MPTYLVVANQTLGGRRLADELRERVERGDARFRVIVPSTLPDKYALNWSIEGIQHFELPLNQSKAFERVREQSEQRLQDLIQRIEDHGGQAEGDLGDADPVIATKDAMERWDVDEVIVSTLPPGISRWLKMDFASRLERKVDVPVTIVEAEPAE